MTLSIYTTVMQITIHYDLPTNMADVYSQAQGRDVTAGAL